MKVFKTYIYLMALKHGAGDKTAHIYDMLLSYAIPADLKI